VACGFVLFSSPSAHFLVYYDTSQRIALPLEICFSALLPLEICSSALLPLENYFSAALPLEKLERPRLPLEESAHDNLPRVTSTNPRTIWQIALTQGLQRGLLR
jgi:hypothetical protein